MLAGWAHSHEAIDGQASDCDEAEQADSQDEAPVARPAARGPPRRQDHDETMAVGVNMCICTM